jgi:site-specific recombinase XerD
MYKYFFQERVNPNKSSLLVDLPKLHEKNIIRLDQNEMADLLNAVEKGEFLSDTQMKYHAKTVRRDVAIITLLLGTGIRISECIGLNISDFDLRIPALKLCGKAEMNQSFIFQMKLQMH